MKQEYHIVAELDNALFFRKTDVPKEFLVKPHINRLLLHAATDWLLIAIFWIASLYLSYWFYPVIALLIASRYHSFGVILHDTTHMPLRKKTFAFRVLEVMVGYPIGSTINAMRYHHLRHHKDSGMHTDPYFKKGVEENHWLKYLFIIKALVLAPFWTFRGLYGTLAFYFVSLQNSYAKVFLQDKTGKDLSQNNEVIQCASEDRWQLLFHIVLYSFIIWYPSFFWYGYFIPVLLSGMFAGYRLLNEHHYIETADRKPETIIATTRDNHLQGILKFFLAPRNIGYHIVHHLHPQVAWYQLPQLRNWYLENHSELYHGKKTMVLEMQE